MRTIIKIKTNLQYHQIKNKAYSMFKESVAPDLRDELTRLNAIVRGRVMTFFFGVYQLLFVMLQLFKYCSIGIKDKVRQKTGSVNKTTEDIRR